MCGCVASGDRRGVVLQKGDRKFGGGGGEKERRPDSILSALTWTLRRTALPAYTQPLHLPSRTQVHHTQRPGLLYRPHCSLFS